MHYYLRISRKRNCEAHTCFSYVKWILGSFFYYKKFKGIGLLLSDYSTLPTPLVTDLVLTGLSCRRLPSSD